MWKTLVLLVVAAWPAHQGGALTIGNERLTLGYFGPTRTSNKFLPGDLVILAYDLNNITFDATGKATFTVAMEVTDSGGKSLFKQPPRNSIGRNYLGGTSLSSFASLPIPPDFPAGSYMLTVTVEDKANKVSKSIQKKLEVLPADFGLVGVGLSADPEGNFPIAPVSTLGTSVYLNYSVAGFDRERTLAKMPHVSVSMQVLDENGKATMPKALTGKAREDIPKDLKVIPMQFGLTLNRVGRFTVELTAKCELSGKSTKMSFPIKVTTLE